MIVGVCWLAYMNKIAVSRKNKLTEELMGYVFY